MLRGSGSGGVHICVTAINHWGAPDVCHRLSMNTNGAYVLVNEWLWQQEQLSGCLHCGMFYSSFGVYFQFESR